MEIRRRVVTLLHTHARFFSLPNSRLTRQIPIHARASLSTSRRAYATPGRPRTTVGEASRPAKKRTAKAPAKTAKAAKAKTPKKSKKTAAPSKPRKPPSEKQLERKAAQKEREEVRRTKDAALLDAPRVTTASAYAQYFSEKAKGQPRVTEQTKSIAAGFKSLSPLEKQHYVTLASEKKEKSIAALTRFIDEHTPEEIRQANSARASLRRKFPKQKRRYPLLRDERGVKRPRSSYIFFSIDQYAANGSNPSIVSRSAELKSQWNALNASEKQRYNDLASQDRSRYQKEYTSVYGHSPKMASATSSPAASP